MITKIFLKNFKGFGEPIQEIPLSKLTLIFGENSSGKSSIIQSILLLKQTFQAIDDKSTILNPRGSLINLVNESDFIHKHDRKKILSLGINFSNSILINLNNAVNSIAWDFKLQNNTLISSYKGNLISNHPSIIGKYIPLKIESKLFDGPHQYSMINNFLNLEEIIHSLDPESKVGKRILKKWNEAIDKCLFFIDDPEADLEGTIFKSKVTEPIGKEEIIREYGSYENFVREEIYHSFFGTLLDDINLPYYYLYELSEKEHLSNKELENYFNSWKIRIKTDFISQIVKLLNFEEKLINKNPLKCKSEELMYYISPETMKVKSKKIFQNYFFSRLKFQFTPQKAFDSLHDKLRRELQRTNFIGPIRSKPERIFYYKSPILNELSYVGKSGEFTAETLSWNENFLKKINETLKSLDINYEIEFEPIFLRNDDGTMFCLYLLDKELGVEVNLTNIGIGVSQILPIVVQSCLPINQNIIIEQPELHLHPRLQSKLGQFFGKRIRETRLDHNFQYIIETHSEHILLKIQKLIRDGFLSKEDVSIIYVDKKEKGSIAYPLEIDEEGYFVDGWPRGFFDHSLDDIFG